VPTPGASGTKRAVGHRHTGTLSHTGWIRQIRHHSLARHKHGVFDSTPVRRYSSHLASAVGVSVWPPCLARRLTLCWLPKDLDWVIPLFAGAWRTPLSRLSHLPRKQSESQPNAQEKPQPQTGTRGQSFRHDIHSLRRLSALDPLHPSDNAACDCRFIRFHQPRVRSSVPLRLTVCAELRRILRSSSPTGALRCRRWVRVADKECAPCGA
jgi:hypothetical protein